MRLLLDTHVVLWWVTGDRRLTKTTRTRIEKASEVGVSAASLWEIAIKRGLGRIDVDLDELRAAVEADGFEEIPITWDDAVRVAALPALHRDPFDRILVAQSIAGSWQLLTRDLAVLRYETVEGFAVVRA